MNPWHSLISWVGANWLVERLLLASLEFAVLSTLAGILLCLARPRTPRLVALVWAIVLLKPLVSLAIGSPVDLVRLSVPQAQPEIAAIESQSTSTSVNVSSTETASTPVRHNDTLHAVSEHGGPVNSAQTAVSHEEQANSPARLVASTPAPAERDASDHWTGWWSWHAFVIALWLSGVVLMGLRAIMVRCRLANILATADSPNSAVHHLYLAVAGKAKIRRPPHLLITQKIESPALVGLWRPSILIPEWLTDPAKSSALFWALRHELLHQKNHDLWLIRLRELVRMLFFFHPSAWWAGKRLEVALEIACDRAVISDEAEAADYAQALYGILDAVQHRRRQPLVGGLFATRSQIARRLRMLVESPLSLHSGLTKKTAFGISLLAVIVLAAGSGLRHELNAQDDVVVDRGDISVGTVVDEQGKPVANASVRLLMADSDAVSTVSDSIGRFLFGAQQEKRGTLVASDDEGKRIGYGEWYPLSDRPVAPQVTLKPAREVTIKVVDASGAPVAGATWTLPGAQYDLDDYLFTGKTGEDGTAKLRFSRDARPFQLIAFKSGLGLDYFKIRQPIRDSDEPLSGNISLTLSGAKTLAIKAVDQKGNPVPGVTFSLNRFKKAEAKEPLFISGCGAVEVTTDGSGRAVFDWLPNHFDGELRFRCVSSDYMVLEKRGRVDTLWVRHDDPVKELVVPVLRRTAISGRVFDQDGKPRAGITVRAVAIPSASLGDSTGRSAEQQTVTDAQGAYRLNVESERTYAVGVMDTNWAASDRIGVVVKENQPVQAVDFQLSEGTIIRGTVMGKSGRPVPNQQVMLLPKGNPMATDSSREINQRFRDFGIPFDRRAQSDNEGRFQFRVGPGNYKLIATETGAFSSQTPQADLTIVNEREVVADLGVEAVATSRLKGKVLDPDGKPVADLRVIGSYFERPIHDDRSFLVRTGADGTFEVERKALPAILGVPSFESKHVGLARIAADQKEAVIKLRPAVEAHGRILDEKGQGAARRRILAAVVFSSEKGSPRFLPVEALTDADGEFALSGLLPDEEYAIGLRDGGSGQDLAKVTIRGPGPVDLGDLRIPPIPDQQALMLKGKVVDAGGQPVHDAEVYVIFLQSWSRGMARTAQMKTSAEGTFEIKRPAVPAVLSVRTADKKLGGMARIDDRQTEVELRAVPLGQARGILTDNAGKPLAGALIMASNFIQVSTGHKTGVLDASVKTAPDGTYTLEGLLPGETYEIRYMVINNRRVATTDLELATIKLDKAETAILGKTALPAAAGVKSD